ncbi:MFS transporter [Kribbella sp. NPDC051620]|uniref:MFS transporter n=1 Tax=Kribbella sp. NPDC051620 TaxID=3364120 RepID=UPI0037A2A2FB
MLTVLRRPLRPAEPVRTYYLLNAFSSFFYVLTFTLSLVYYVKDVGLNPLEMVLVGTVLEATVFLAEVPTGVVADLVSRRLSIIVGLLLIGPAFLLQASVPTFAAVLIAQVIWGVGYTFTSGALEAWITDEIGEDGVTPVFTREQQIHLTATVLATVTAGGLGLISLRLPMVVSGIGFLMLAVAMLAVMPERNFSPTPKGDRDTFTHLTSTLVEGLKAARRRPVVRYFFLISILAGLSSEAFDRLWTVRVLNDLGLPSLFGQTSPAIWFAVFALISTVLSLATSLVVNKVSAERVNSLHPNGLLALLTVLQVAGIAGLAVFGNLWVALAAMWLRDAAVAVALPIQTSWLNRNVDSQSRATVMSLNGQADAIGQVVGGPPLGALGNRTSLTTALVASAVILSPTALLYLRLRPTAGADTSPPEADAGTPPTTAPLNTQLPTGPGPTDET